MNGIGIDYEHSKYMFAPNITGKQNKRKLRGEKGVGLSFLVFSCNKLELETYNGTEIIKGKIKNANHWLNNKDAEKPNLERNIDTNSKPSISTYTKFTIAEIPNETFDIFSYSKTELIYILRTRTAIGNTSILFGNKPWKDIEITLTCIEEDGVESKEKIPYEYDAPHNYIKHINYEDMQEKLKNSEQTKVKGKPVKRYYETTTQSGKLLKCYYFASSSTKYKEVSENIAKGKSLMRGKIYISTKSMPTGISIAPPSIGKTGYWSNLYIMIEYDSLNLDMGRKSVSGRVSKMITDEAQNIFKDITKYLQNIVGRSQEENTKHKKIRDAEMEEKWDNLSELDSLKISRLSFSKIPQTEQGVIALFYELIGMNKLGNYKTWSISSIDQYDAYIKYEKEGKKYRTILEFKYKAEDIIDDIKNDVKDYTKIEVLVSWSIDKAKFRNENYDVDEVEIQEDSFYQGATHKVSYAGMDEIYVICLEKFIERLKSKK